MLAAVFAFIRTPLGKDVGIALAVLALFLGWSAHERSVGAEPYKKANAAALAHSREIEANAASISDNARKTLDQRQAQIITNTRTLIQKVPVYVPAAADAQCVVPLGFVQLHDAAAQGLPAPAGEPEQTPSGVPLSAVAETVVSNYGVAYDWKAEALTWREWYSKQAALYGKKH